MLDRRDVLDPFPVDGRVQNLEFLSQLRVLGVRGEKVVRGHAELVVLDGDVEARVRELGGEEGPLVEEAGPDLGGLPRLGKGERGRHGLVFFFFFFFFFSKDENREEKEERT